MFTDEAYYRYRRDNPGSSVNDRSKVYDIVKEYGFIKRFLVSHPAAYESFFKIYVIQKYYAYMDAYIRIDRKYRPEFLKKCAEEFSADLMALKDDPEELDSYAFYEMIRIIDSPDIYYYESALDEYGKSLEQLKKDLDVLKRYTGKGEPEC